MKRNIATGLAAILLALSSGVSAASLCPPELATQQSIASPPAGFEVAEDTYGPHQLNHVEVFDGPVKEMASLVPDVDKGSESRWILGAWSEKRGIEVACHYSRTRLMLVAKAPKGAKACVVKYRPRSEGTIDGYPQIASVECK